MRESCLLTPKGKKAHATEGLELTQFKMLPERRRASQLKNRYHIQITRDGNESVYYCKNQTNERTIISGVFLFQ